MSYERANPIPPGTYWVDVIDPSVLSPERIEEFDAWAAANGVEVLKKERKVTGSPLDWVRGVRHWVLFRITKPTRRWPASLPIGLPNRAAPTVKKEADTSQREPEKSVPEYWGVPEMKMPNVGPVAFLVALALFAMRK